MRKYGEENQTVRCFPTKCRNCGKPVLYWENVKGSKVFFDYPIIEKFHQHYCKIASKKIPEKSFTERQYEIHNVEKFQCPLCGKIFDKEAELNQHLKDRQRTDPLYQEFFQNMLVFDVVGENSEKSVINKKKVSNYGNSSQFGKVLLRKPKRSKTLKNP